MLCILCCPLEISIVVDNLLQKGRDICTQQELHLQSNLLSEIFGKFISYIHTMGPGVGSPTAD